MSVRAERTIPNDRSTGIDGDGAIMSIARLAGFRYWNDRMNRLRGRQRAIIVMYHSFTPGGWDAIAPSTLRWHLELIRDSYEVVPLSRLATALQHRAPTDRKVALTFDDAYEDFFTVAYPILVELRIRATLFVPTGLIGAESGWYDRTRRPLRIASAARLRELDPSLVSLGSHSVQHRRLAGLAPADLETEVRRSKSDLESVVETPVTLFSYPYGDRSSYTPSTIRALRAAGFAAAVTTRWETYSSARELFSLPRISFNEFDGVEQVRGKLAGDFDWVAARALAAHSVRAAIAGLR